VPEVSELTETKPLELPLPGGSDAATVTVRPLLTAELAMPPDFYDRPSSALGRLSTLITALRGPRDDWAKCPVPAFLVEHPTAGAFLIDTGLHRCCAQPDSANLGLLTRFTKITMNPEQSAVERLRARGIDPGSLKLVVMTHLHNDHASACSDFPNATFICDRAEWASANAKRAKWNGYVHTHFDLAIDWRLADYGSTPVESFAGFARTLDLFGDGSVRLISTPGHSAGHQSVLLRLAQGEMLVIGDAAPTEAILDGEAEPFLVEDGHLANRSIREIRSYRQLTPNALLVPGHDSAAWNRLDAVYG
jgi:glyoxylase-like metal-dependent hydrolase (beta-lactamase superfamily II)